MILRVLLALLGVVFTAFGVNVGAGGIASLGLQVDPSFVASSDPAAYAIQDSHVRFMGGVFTCVGLSFVWGAMRGPQAYGFLMLLSAFVTVGGIFRLTGMLPGAVWPSFGAELILMPALAFWLNRTRES